MKTRGEELEFGCVASCFLGSWILTLEKGLGRYSKYGWKVK